MDWLNAATVGTAAAVVGALTPFILRWLDRRRSQPVPTQAAQPTRRDRSVMLRRVRNSWITGVLEPSLAEVARLTLGLQHRPEILDLGTRTRRSVGRPPQPLSLGTPISKVFDNAAGGLLILGAPGAGKTTLLLRLADELLARAEGDADQPIPVVVNLASWARRRQPLATWLVEELVVGYTMPERTIRAWVEADALVLLLDGLDEVAETHRAACAYAINTYRREHGVVSMAVCSRTQELQALATKLRLDEAVELQPPSDAEIDAYLGHLEATGTALTDVRAALTSDQELRALLRSPLLLHVVALAYHGPRRVAALQAPGSLQERQARLWEAYLSRMFEQRPLEPGYGYSAERAVSWLAWLAGRLRDRDQTQFQLDRLDDSWLPTPAQRWLVRVATMLAAGLLVGLLVGLLIRVMAMLSDRSVELAISGLAYGLVYGSVAALVVGRARSTAPTEELHWSPSGLAVGLAGGLPGGLVGGLMSDPFGGPYQLEYLRLNTLVGHLVYGLSYGLLFGLMFGLVGRLVGRRTQSMPSAKERRWSRGGLAIGLVGGVAMGLLFGWGYGQLVGLGTGLGYGLGFGLVFGLVGRVREERTRPNDGIRRSAQHALVAGLVVALIAGPPVQLEAGPDAGLTSLLSIGLVIALPLALVIGLAFGGDACLRHYGVRVALTRAGAAPWRYESFLEAMTHRLLLRSSGSAYLFVHRLLRDHLGETAVRPHTSSTAERGRRPLT